MQNKGCQKVKLRYVVEVDGLSMDNDPSHIPTVTFHASHRYWPHEFLKFNTISVTSVETEQVWDTNEIPVDMWRAVSTTFASTLKSDDSHQYWGSSGRVDTVVTTAERSWRKIGGLLYNSRNEDLIEPEPVRITKADTRWRLPIFVSRSSCGILQSNAQHWTLIWTGSNFYRMPQCEQMFCYAYDDKKWHKISPTEFWERFSLDFDLISLMLPSQST